MKISKWKSIQQWKPSTLALNQVEDLICENWRQLPMEMYKQLNFTVTRQASIILKDKVVEEVVGWERYNELVKIGSVIVSSKIEIHHNQFLKPVAEGVWQKIANMVAASDNNPVMVDDYIIRCIEYFPARYMWLFKGNIYLMEIGSSDKRAYSIDEAQLLVLEYYDKDRQKWEQLKRKYQSDTIENVAYSRERIPEDIRIAVWRRDDGKCARCGSRERLEYDHIVPVSKGGSNTARNIELLCEKCNRAKSNHIE